MSKYAFVTGGSRGIGRAVCVKLAQMGFCVIVNYVSNDAAAKETIRLIEEVGGRGELLKFDVADTDASVKAITGWQESHPDNYVEVLVNIGWRAEGQPSALGLNQKIGSRWCPRI